MTIVRTAHVLTYHSGNIDGNDYSSNNLVAFREDLRVIKSLNRPILPLRTIVDALVSSTTQQLPPNVVALTFDDGLDFDFYELDHPHHGPQPSVLGILQQFARESRLPAHVTSFVVASEAARTAICQKEMLGHLWINDSWWAKAVQSGFFHIANHTWDHVSPSAGFDSGEADRRGSSRYIDTLALARLQIDSSRAYIDSIAPNPGSALLAFPYGDPGNYLSTEYLPDGELNRGTVAAFTAEPGAIVPTSNRWSLPRNTCGLTWTSPEGLQKILTDSS